jgi:hypothetical protein
VNIYRKETNLWLDINRRFPSQIYNPKSLVPHEEVPTPFPVPSTCKCTYRYIKVYWSKILRYGCTQYLVLILNINFTAKAIGLKDTTLREDGNREDFSKQDFPSYSIPTSEPPHAAGPGFEAKVIQDHGIAGLEDFWVRDTSVGHVRVNPTPPVPGWALHKRNRSDVLLQSVYICDTILYVLPFPCPSKAEIILRMRIQGVGITARASP